MTVSERRQQLLDNIRRTGGTWDWRRARETYETRIEPHLVRRDLQELCKAGDLARIGLGEYQSADCTATGTILLDGQPVVVISNRQPHDGDSHHDNVHGDWDGEEQQ